MIVVIVHRTRFDTTQYDSVSNIAFDKDSGIYTITYGNAQTVTISKTDWLISVLFN